MSQAKIISDAVRQLENQVNQLTNECDAAKLELHQSQQSLAVAQAEIISLRKTINRAEKKADHYMIQHAGLGAGLNHVVTALLDVIKRHQTHAYTDSVVVDTRPTAQVSPLRSVAG